MGKKCEERDCRREVAQGERFCPHHKSKKNSILKKVVTGTVVVLGVIAYGAVKLLGGGKKGSA